MSHINYIDMSSAPLNVIDQEYNPSITFLPRT